MMSPPSGYSSGDDRPPYATAEQVPLLYFAARMLSEQV